MGRRKENIVGGQSRQRRPSCNFLRFLHFLGRSRTGNSAIRILLHIKGVRRSAHPFTVEETRQREEGGSSRSIFFKESPVTSGGKYYVQFILRNRPRLTRRSCAKGPARRRLITSERERKTIYLPINQAPSMTLEPFAQRVRIRRQRTRRAQQTFIML